MNSPGKNRKKTIGFIMIGVGFMMIFANGLDYVYGWGGKLIPLMIVGLALVVSGATLSSK